MKLLAAISHHGLGHLAQAAPVLNALHVLQPDLELTVWSGLSRAALQARLRIPLVHRAEAADVGMAMTDAMRFAPDRLTVRQGETVRFVFRNRGQTLHEFVLGTKAVLEEHAALMMKSPDMEHDEPYMAHVAPGTSGEIVWTFNRAGEFDFACLIPGHYQAGMVGQVVVTPATQRSR